MKENPYTKSGRFRNDITLIIKYKHPHQDLLSFSEDQAWITNNL